MPEQIEKDLHGNEIHHQCNDQCATADTETARSFENAGVSTVKEKQCYQKQNHRQKQLISQQCQTVSTGKRTFFRLKHIHCFPGNEMLSFDQHRSPAASFQHRNDLCHLFFGGSSSGSLIDRQCSTGKNTGQHTFEFIGGFSGKFQQTGQFSGCFFCGRRNQFISHHIISCIRNRPDNSDFSAVDLFGDLFSGDTEIGQILEFLQQFRMFFFNLSSYLPAVHQFFRPQYPGLVAGIRRGVLNTKHVEKHFGFPGDPVFDTPVYPAGFQRLCGGLLTQFFGRPGIHISKIRPGPDRKRSPLTIHPDRQIPLLVFRQQQQN